MVKIVSTDYGLPVYRNAEHCGAKSGEGANSKKARVKFILRALDQPYGDPGGRREIVEPRDAHAASQCQPLAIPIPPANATASRGEASGCEVKRPSSPWGGEPLQRWQVASSGLSGVYQAPAIRH
ncbi:hypothetical protein [Bradyrhizobium sp. URHC0002]